MKVTLFLMTKKGLDVLKTIINHGYKDIIEQIIVSKDKNVQNDYCQEICNIANDNDIEYHDKNSGFTINSEYSIAVSWRWMINDLNNSKLIIFHDSLLPKYRGFAPLVNMLINKEPKIGVTALFATKDYDRGDIILQRSLEITYPLKIYDAIQLSISLYTELICEIISLIDKKHDVPVKKQNENEASYSLWRDEEDYNIDWSHSSEDICRFIDSVGFPYKGASTLIDDIKHRILSAKVVDDIEIENRVPGKLIFMQDGLPIVVCGKGLLMIDEMIDDNGRNALPLSKFRVRFK